MHSVPWQYEQVAYENGRSVHGDLGLEPSAFALRIRQVVEKHDLKTGVVADGLKASDALGRRLHVPDLYLTAACAQRSEQGWQRFGEIYRPHIQRLCGWTWRNVSTAADQAQNLFIDLYLPDRSGQCRIASYEGMSSLVTWLRILVANRSINERLRRDNRGASLDEVPDPVDTVAFGRIETMFAVRRYEPLAALALKHAYETLTVRERLLLLWRFEQNLRLGEIARLAQVHQSNITRQMDRAMKKVRTGMVRHLNARYGLSASAAQDCLTTMSDHMPETFSVIDLLRKSVSSECPAPLVRGAAG